MLLLDEVTVDMDVVGRLDLLHFFQQEGAERGAVVIYATHIFDGLEDWITHLAYVHNGQLKIGEIPPQCWSKQLFNVQAWAVQAWVCALLVNCAGYNHARADLGCCPT